MAGSVFEIRVWRGESAACFSVLSSAAETNPLASCDTKRSESAADFVAVPTPQSLPAGRGRPVTGQGTR